MHTTRWQAVLVGLVGLCGAACVVDSSGDGTTDGGSSDGSTTTGSVSTAAATTTDSSSGAAGPVDGDTSTGGADGDTTDGTTSSTESSTGDASSTGSESGCAFPESVLMTGFATDGWAYLCFDPDTGACGLVQGQAEEIDPCGDISGTPAVQFFRAIGLSELSLRTEDDSINPWELLSSTEGSVSSTVIRGLAFDTSYTVTLQPVGSSDVYELVVSFGFEGTAIADIESFGVMR